MALTCSVLGHAYADPTVERDREERGSEVVITVREYETCTRCDRTRVVSENKEVTAVEDDGEPAAGGQEPTERDPSDAAASVDSGSATGRETGGVESTTEGEAGTDPASIVDAEAGPGVEDERDAPGVADADRQSTAEEDAVVLDADDGEERGPGEWPQSDEDPDETEWRPTDDAAHEPEIERSLGRTVTVPEGEFHCGECGYTTTVEASSLREGDFCPECHRGTLEHVSED